MVRPSYLELYHTGKLAEKVKTAQARLSSCDFCPWQCGVDRNKDKKGFCKTGRFARVASYNPHFGEEKPISGYAGSGTIFFSFCNLQCDFCQNYHCSQQGDGIEISAEKLASYMIHLQNKGCHNINLVSPSHVIPQILEALLIACEMGLEIPLVYNTGGYDSVESIRFLHKVVDIYMPDMKYASNNSALNYSGIYQYVDYNQASVLEMYKQVGDLVTNLYGVASQGLLIRHLVLPGHIEETEAILRFISEKTSQTSFVNVMFQYHPCYNAYLHTNLSRNLNPDEIATAQSLKKRYFA